MLGPREDAVDGQRAWPIIGARPSPIPVERRGIVERAGRRQGQPVGRRRRKLELLLRSSARQPSPTGRGTMTPTDEPVEMPDELRGLGEYRQLFQSTGRGLWSSTVRSVLPMLAAAAMVAAAEKWLVPRTWKYYLLCSVAALMFLNGVWILVRTWLRRRQKVAVFEHGVALWRNDVLTAWRWDQIEDVDATFSTSEGAASTLAFFSFVCRSDDGRRTKIRFNPAGDPIPNLRELWRVREEGSARSRIAAVQDEVAAGQEPVFVKKIWGKAVGTKVGISRWGIRATPRYESPRFLDWLRVESVTADADRVRVAETGEEDFWLSEPLWELPGYAAMVAAAEHARQEFRNLYEQLRRDRIPAALADLEAGRELVFGKIGVSLRGLSYESGLTAWNDLYSMRMGFDHLSFHQNSSERRLDYEQLDLADRLVLWAVAEAAKLKSYAEDDDDDEDEDELDEGEESSP